MRKALPLFLIAACFLTGCSKSKSSSASANAVGTATSADDQVQKKLQELAGSGAKNCGLLKSQVPGEMETGSKSLLSPQKQRAHFMWNTNCPA